MSVSRRTKANQVKNVYTFSNLKRLNSLDDLDTKTDLLIVNKPWSGNASSRSRLQEEQVAISITDFIQGLQNIGEITNVIVSPEVNENVIEVRTLEETGKTTYFIAAKIGGVPLDQYLADTFLTIDTTLVEEVESIGVGTVGGVEEGFIFPVGISLVDILKAIFQKVQPAVYIQSSASIAMNTASVVEVGFQFSTQLTITYTQRDSGASTQGEFFIDNISSNIQNAPGPVYNFTVNSTSLTSDGATKTYKGQVNHDQGAQKFDNFGNPSGDPSVLVPARNDLNTVNTLTVTARRKIFYGKNNPAPTTSAAVRSLGSSQFSTDNTFEIVIGNGDTSVEFGIPSNKTLSLVIFRGALVSDETAIFQATETTVPVDGATPGSDSDNYKVYRYVPNIPFESAAQYEITLS